MSSGKELKNLEAINVEEYYERYAPMVLRRCRTLLKDEEKSLDAMHEVFVKLLIHRQRLRHQYPSSLLFRMATNICLNMLRAQRLSPAVSDDRTLQSIACHDELEKKAAVSSILDRIFRREKPSTREIAVLHFVDGLSLREVAREVGLSLSGVRKRLRKLRADLAQNSDRGELK